jgi:hypothetical protein
MWRCRWPLLLRDKYNNFTLLHSSGKSNFLSNMNAKSHHECTRLIIVLLGFLIVVWNDFASLKLRTSSNHCIFLCSYSLLPCNTSCYEPSWIVVAFERLPKMLMDSISLGKDGTQIRVFGRKASRLCSCWCQEQSCQKMWLNQQHEPTTGIKFPTLLEDNSNRTAVPSSGNSSGLFRWSLIPYLTRYLNLKNCELKIWTETRV